MRHGTTTEQLELERLDEIDELELIELKDDKLLLIEELDEIEESELNEDADSGANVGIHTRAGILTAVLRQIAHLGYE